MPGILENTWKPSAICDHVEGRGYSRHLAYGQRSGKLADTSYTCLNEIKFRWVHDTGLMIWKREVVGGTGPDIGLPTLHQIVALQRCQGGGFKTSDHRNFGLFMRNSSYVVLTGNEIVPLSHSATQTLRKRNEKDYSTCLIWPNYSPEENDHMPRDLNFQIVISRK